MEKHFSGCELVEMAIQIEKNGKEFYSVLAVSAENPSASKVFKCLASEEDKHIEVFRRIFKSVCVYTPKEAYPEEYFAYMNMLAREYVFTQENMGKKTAQNIKNYSDGIDLGIAFEKESILFYEGARELVPEKDKPLIEKLISDEKNHLAKLCGLKEK